MRKPKTDKSGRIAVNNWKTRCHSASELVRALSHEHRMMIVSLLVNKERSVGELEQILELPQPAVSQQLARLRSGDLVSARRDGRTIYYSSDVNKLQELIQTLADLFCLQLQSITPEDTVAVEPDMSEEMPIADATG